MLEKVFGKHLCHFGWIIHYNIIYLTEGTGEGLNFLNFVDFFPHMTVLFMLAMIDDTHDFQQENFVSLYILF